MTLDQMLEGCVSVLHFGGEWHVRRQGTNVFTKGPTAVAAIRAAFSSEPLVVLKIATLCSVCGKEQFDTPGGVSCPEGHGGAEPLEPNDDLFGNDDLFS